MVINRYILVMVQAKIVILTRLAPEFGNAPCLFT